MKKFRMGSIVLMMIIFSWSHSFGNVIPAPQGELRIVDQQPLNWLSITMNIFEHLIELDKDAKLVPRLATDWQWLDDRTLEVTLRQGVKFHNGEVFDAKIVKLNWDQQTRLKQPFMHGKFMNFKPGSKLEILGPYKIRFSFPEPDGGALAKLTVMLIGNRQFYDSFGWGEKHW